MTSRFKSEDPLAPVVAYEHWLNTKPAAHISSPRQCYILQEDRVWAIWISAWNSARKEFA